MNRSEHLVTILAEECVETAQRASKLLRFGAAEVQPGQPLTNSERVMREFLDILAAIEMLQQEGVLPEVDDTKRLAHIAGKKVQVERFLLLSRDVGTLE